jgi:hypothetical protein
VLFYSLHPNGHQNSRSRHQGLPTQDDGEGKDKMIVNFWYREKRWWGYTHF